MLVPSLNPSQSFGWALAAAYERDDLVRPLAAAEEDHADRIVQDHLVDIRRALLGGGGVAPACGVEIGAGLHLEAQALQLCEDRRIELFRGKPAGGDDADDVAGGQCCGYFWGFHGSSSS